MLVFSLAHTEVGKGTLKQQKKKEKYFADGDLEAQQKRFCFTLVKLTSFKLTALL